MIKKNILQKAHLFWAWSCALPYRTHLFFQQESWHPYGAGRYVWVCTHPYVYNR